MNNRILHLTYVLVFLVQTLFCSCDHIELEHRDQTKWSKIEVIFDWSADPEATAGEMVVYFFRLGVVSDNAKPSPRNGTKYTFEFMGRDGGVIALPPGTYAAICHNNDSDRHGIVGHDSFDEFGLRLSDLVKSGSTKNENVERIAYEPDGIWCASVPAITITAPGNEEQESDIQRITFNMQSVVQQLTFIIHHPVNFTESTRINADITGMAGTVHPGRSVTGDETVTHSFTMSPDGKGRLTGHLRAFGHCSGRPISTRQDIVDSALHMLHLSDGKGWKSSHDVTEKMHAWEDGDEIIVELDSVVLPLSGGSPGGGFTPTVSGWQGSQEVIGM